MNEFQFPFNLEDIKSHPHARSGFSKIERIEEGMDDLKTEIHAKLNHNLDALEDDNRVFAVLYETIQDICRTDGSHRERESIVTLLKYLLTMSLSEFEKYKRVISRFSDPSSRARRQQGLNEIEEVDEDREDDSENENQNQNEGSHPIQLENPILEENEDSQLIEILSNLRQNEEFIKSVNITKKLLFLVMIYFKKGLRLKKKSISKRKIKNSVKKAELKGFEELFNVIHQVARRGVLRLILDVNQDAMLLRHCSFLLANMINSNLVERKLTTFKMFELFNQFLAHPLFEPKAALSSLLLTMETDYTHSLKFLSKLFKFFLDSNRQNNIRLLVNFSQSLMNSVVNTKHFSPDGNLAKNCRELYEGLAEHTPEFFFRNFKIFKNFFASDFYIFRNIANSIVFEILVYLENQNKLMNQDNVDQILSVLDESAGSGMEAPGRPASDRNSSRNSHPNDQIVKAKERIHNLKISFLELILIRLNDKAVYSRNHSLKIVGKIVQSNFFSKNVYICIFELVTKRTRDSKFNVRKRALILVQQMLVFFRDVLEVPGYKRLKLMMKEEQAKKQKKRKQLRENMVKIAEDPENVPATQPDEDFDEDEARDTVAPLDQGTPETPNPNEMTQIEKEITLNLDIYNIIKKQLVDLKENLFSKNYSMECVQALRIVNLLLMIEVKTAPSLWRQSLSLIWVKVPQIKQELLKIFHKLYIDGCIPELVVKMFIGFRSKLSIANRASFDEIIRQLLIQERVFRNDEFNREHSFQSPSQSRINLSQNSQNYESSSRNAVTRNKNRSKQELWYQNIFLQSSIANYFFEFYLEKKEQNLEQAIQALEILNLILEISPRFVYEKIDKFRLEILEMVKTPDSELNWRIAGQFALSFQFLKDEKNENTPNLKELKANFLMVMVDFLYSYQGTADEYYVDGMKQIVHLCFVYRKNPEVISEHILKKMSRFIFDNNEIENENLNTVTTRKLMHLVETAGQIALNFIFFYDLTLKKLEELKKERDNQNTSTLDPRHQSPAGRQRIQEEHEGHKELEKALGGADAEFEIRNQALKVLLEKGLLQDQMLGVILELIQDFIFSSVPEIPMGIGENREIEFEDDTVFLPKNYVHSEKEAGAIEKEIKEEHETESNDHANQELHNTLVTSEMESRPSVGLRSVRRREPKRHSERAFFTHNSQDLQMALLKTCVSCLVKFMVLNEKCCADHIDLVFTLLWNPHITCDIKEIIILGLADSLYRHTTILNEQKTRIFKFLRFRNIHLRHLSLVVLSQLVLSDYLKIKNETIDFVLLLSDESEKIVDGVRHFFQELKKKDPRIFSNLIPEAIKRFSQTGREQNLNKPQIKIKEESPQIMDLEKDQKIQEENSNQENNDQSSEEAGTDGLNPPDQDKVAFQLKEAYSFEKQHETFTNFLDFVFDFIDKDRVGPFLAEKLCNRLKFNKNKLEILNIFTCFFYFIQNDKSLLKLLSFSSVLKEKMEDETIRRIMTALYDNKLKKSNKINKLTLADFHKLLTSRHEALAEEEEEQDSVNESGMVMHVKSRRRRRRTGHQVEESSQSQ